MEDSKASADSIRTYLREQGIELTFDRIVIQAMSGIAQGPFASLLIGTVISIIGKFILGSVGEFCKRISGYTEQMQGAAMAMAIDYTLQCPPHVLFSLTTVGFAANALGDAGGPLAVYFVSLIAVFFGKLVSKRIAMGLLVTPTVIIVVGVMVANFLAPPVGAGASTVGCVIVWVTEQQPLLMGMLVATIAGIALTLPIDSAAICAALSLVGLAEGAAVTGRCAQMVGLAVCSYRENRISGLSSVGLDTAILMSPGILKKPVLWLPPLIIRVITGSVTTCVFHLRTNGTPISSGMGTCGLVGPIGVMIGWFSPDQAAVSVNETAISPVLRDWIGLALICFTLPVLLSLVISEFMKKEDWIQQGDYTLM